MNPNIAKLIKEFKENNQKEVLITLWEDFQPLVLSYMRKFYIQPHNRDDVRQDSFVLLLECANNYDPSTGVPFESYYKIHLHYSFLNRIKQKTELLVIDYDWENGCSMSDWMESIIGDAPKQAQLKETTLALIKALEKLTDKQRQAVTLFYLQEVPLTQIAKKMGCSYKVAFKHKDAGLKKLRQQLEVLKNDDYN